MPYLKNKIQIGCAGLCDISKLLNNEGGRLDC